MFGRDDDHTGARIKEQRKLARLTQRQLAERLPYSYSLLNQVECGAKSASPDFVAAVAQALRIDVTVLTGQPYVTEPSRTAWLPWFGRSVRHSTCTTSAWTTNFPVALRQSLSPRRTGCAGRYARPACERRRASFPGSSQSLTAAAWRAPTTGLWQALASTYRTAHDISVKLGYYDLSSVALDRMDWAARRASDPCLAAIRQYMRALAYFREGEYRIGQRLIAVGHDLVAGAEPTRESTAVTGQLHLGASIIAARAGQQSTVEIHLAEARLCASRTGEAAEIHWLSFGPANVSLHQMSAAVEMRQYDKAVAQAKKITLPPTLATSRRAHFLIDRARSEMETGRTDAALNSLVEARRTAPEQTRYHPGARETITGLVHTSRRTPESLGHMAAWIGL